MRNPILIQFNNSAQIMKIRPKIRGGQGSCSQCITSVVSNLHVTRITSYCRVSYELHPIHLSEHPSSNIDLDEPAREVQMKDSLKAALWCALSLLLCTFTSSNMTIPSSFSSAHKTSYLQENSPVESIIKVLTSYQVDSHIEVVLVGDAFQSAMVGELSSSLKVLSDVAAAASPLKFVHEELVYHISVGGGLEQKIRDRISLNSNSVSVKAIGEVLSEFHSHAATATTIFVVHLGNLSSHTYSAKIANCPQRAFLAKTGFALLDLSARAAILRSTDNSNDHIISEMEFSFLNSVQKTSHSNAMHTSIHDLASLIHRSGEAIIPFPIFSSDIALLGDASASTGRKRMDIIEPEIYEVMPYVDEASPIQDETAIDIVVFILCMAGGECVDDRDTKHAIENLLVELSADVNNINLVSYHISADKDTHLAHAIHAATSYASPGSSDSLKVRAVQHLTAFHCTTYSSSYHLIRAGSNFTTQS